MKNSLGNPGKLRIILAGLEPYFEFINLGQVFDNTRMLEDIDIGNSIPAEQYVVNSMDYFKKIDIFEGAKNP